MTQLNKHLRRYRSNHERFESRPTGAPAHDLVNDYPDDIAACGGSAANDSTAAASADGEARHLNVSGAFALFPMMTVWAEEYSAVTPSVTFDVQGGGAGKGMTDVLAGAVDIAMVSRDLRQEEIDQGAFGVPVTIDAVVPTVNANNPYLEQTWRPASRRRKRPQFG
ncbi:MAG: substrate-binding domain-containing protein [Chloroflexota bacterium]